MGLHSSLVEGREELGLDTNSLDGLGVPLIFIFSAPACLFSCIPPSSELSGALRDLRGVLSQAVITAKKPATLPVHPEQFSACKEKSQWPRQDLIAPTALFLGY